MSEFKAEGVYYDIEKDGVYYKKEGNGLCVLRRTSWVQYWKTCKHCDYDTYYGYAKYSNIEIPSEIDGMKVTKIERASRAYSECAITNVTIPNTVKSLGESLRYYNNMTFPTSIVDSNYEEVENCSNIKLPNSVLTIGSIYRCNMLTIPASVISIQYIDNWNSCILKMESKTPPMLVKCDDMNADDILFVPVGAIEAYKNDPQWGKFKNIREDSTLGNENSTKPVKQTTVAQSSANIDKEIAPLKKEITELKSELSSTKSEFASVKSELASVKSELASVKSELAAVKQQLAEFSKAFNEKIVKIQAMPAASCEQRAMSSEPKTVKQEPKAEPKVEQKPTLKQETKSQNFKLADYKFKGKMCLAIVKYYVEQHPNITLDELKGAFNVMKSDQIVASLDEAMKTKDSAGKAGGSYYIKNDDQITLADKTKAVVFNYWGERYFNAFIDNAKRFGITVEI